MNEEIAVYDNTVSARMYIGYIAEQAGGFACIGRDGKLYIKTIGENIANIDLEYFGDFKWGEKFKVSRIAYEDGIQDFKLGTTENNTIWINQDNMYIVDQEQIQNIYNQYENFECYSFEGTSIIDPALDIGDIVIIDGKRVIYQGDLEYVGKFKVNISSNIQSKEKEETTVRNVSDKTKIRRIQSEINQIDGTIKQLTQETTENTEKITEQTQDINSIKDKVSNITDLTRSASGNKYITLENCIAGNLLELHIYGNNTVFEYLYPSDTLYPADNLYPKGDSRIVVGNARAGSEEILSEEIYELGIMDVLRQNGDICDEYILSGGQAKVIRRINTDGSIKDTEVIEDLGEFNIPLKEGDNTLYIKNYAAKLDAKYAIKSEYSEVFASKVEMNASIETKANEINLVVKKKVDEDEVIAKINMSAETAGINANKIELSANDVLNLLAGNTINMSGLKITLSSTNLSVDENGNMTCSNANITGGKLNIGADIGQILVNVHAISASTGKEVRAYITPGNFTVNVGREGTEGTDLISLGAPFSDGNHFGLIQLLEEAGDGETIIYPGDANFWKDGSQTYIAGTGITTPLVNQTSLENQKKNFEKLENALEIIKQVDIYKYNLKSEKDTDKKHMGFVIGDNYKYSKELTSNNNDGADTYSLASCCLAGMKELLQQLEEMQKEIKQLKEGK